MIYRIKVFLLRTFYFLIDFFCAGVAKSQLQSALDNQSLGYKQIVERQEKEILAYKEALKENRTPIIGQYVYPDDYVSEEIVWVSIPLNTFPGCKFYFSGQAKIKHLGKTLQFLVDKHGFDTVYTIYTDRGDYKGHIEAIWHRIISKIHANNKSLSIFRITKQSIRQAPVRMKRVLPKIVYVPVEDCEVPYNFDLDYRGRQLLASFCDIDRQAYEYLIKRLK